VDLNTREIRFWNLLYFLVICGVPARYLPVMLRKFICGLTYREIAKDYECSFQNIEIKVKNSMKKIKRNKNLKKFDM
jgi:DNA-directed RNA polymerase specialized sigma24 family protein